MSRRRRRSFNLQSLPRTPPLGSPPPPSKRQRWNEEGARHAAIFVGDAHAQQLDELEQVDVDAMQLDRDEVDEVDAHAQQLDEVEEVDAGAQLDEVEVDAGAQLDEVEVDAGAQLDEVEVDAGAQLDEVEVDAGAQLDEVEVDAGAQLDEVEVDAGAQLDEVEEVDAGTMQLDAGAMQLDEVEEVDAHNGLQWRAPQRWANSHGPHHRRCRLPKEPSGHHPATTCVSKHVSVLSFATTRTLQWQDFKSSSATCILSLNGRHGSSSCGMPTCHIRRPHRF
ncbi:hypothetical protein BDZ88DRAFT_41316 [Geranomyces variabilis]|nr:hypothetical protein BDZ88DRAFT_41316 [Geranomyces variabilis]